MLCKQYIPQICLFFHKDCLFLAFSNCSCLINCSIFCYHLYVGIRYTVNDKFFETWTPTMAYLLGYLYADGSLEDASYLRGKYLRVTSIDKELIDFTRGALSSAHKIVVIPPQSPTQKTRYFLRIGNHKIYSDLFALGLYPNKSLTMKFPKVPAGYLAHFVRGYFDGDGHVSVVMKGEVLSRLIIVFVSGSVDFLSALAYELDTLLALKINKVYQRGHVCRLAYSTADSAKLFQYMYGQSDGVFLNRKFGVFKNFFTQYNKWANSETLRILGYNGHVVK